MFFCWLILPEGRVNELRYFPPLHIEIFGATQRWVNSKFTTFQPCIFFSFKMKKFYNFTVKCRLVFKKKFLRQRN